MNFLDKFKIRKSIKQYIINWHNPEELNARNKLLNQLFFQDCDNYPLLERVVFKVNGSNNLLSVVRYLVEHKKEIFVNKAIQSRLAHFQAIEFELDFDSYCGVIDDDTLASQNDCVMGDTFAVDDAITILDVGQWIDSLANYSCLAP